MRRIKRRATSALLIAAGLVLGLTVFLLRLHADGGDWAMYAANQSVYTNGVLHTGSLTDRLGVPLTRSAEGLQYYAEDAALRRACFHAVGDFAGNVGTGALVAFRGRLAGYSPAFGTTRGGQTVALSLDARLQTAALEALAGRRGAVLIMNYETGEILCMVSGPTMDPQNPPASLESPEYEGVYLNRCLSASFSPGSVFKLVTLTAALERIDDLAGRSFFCAGSVAVDGVTVNCTGYHGSQTIEQALANSCNCAFAELSLELGGKTLAKYAEELGFTKSQSLDGIATAAGRFDEAEPGSADLAWSGIGQYTDLICPYSLLRLSAAAANGGLLREPTLLQGERNSQTRLLKADTASKLRDMMDYNVQYAYGSWLFPNLAVCGKTGTAELGDGTEHAWFTGFLKEGEPLAFVVLVERGGGGLAVAGPVANKVLQKAVSLTT